MFLELYVCIVRALIRFESLNSLTKRKNLNTKFVLIVILILGCMYVCMCVCMYVCMY